MDADAPLPGYHEASAAADRCFSALGALGAAITRVDREDDEQWSSHLRSHRTAPRPDCDYCLAHEDRARQAPGASVLVREEAAHG